MKKIGILLFALIFFAFGGASYADLNNGLVAYYPFNGNANDESGNGNDGTVYGAILTEDRFGNLGSAYSFDGVNDYISTPVRDRNPISVSFWTKTPIQNYLWNAMITSHIYHQDSGHFTISNSYYRNGVVTVTSISSNQHDLVGNTPIDDSQWHHIIITSNGLTNKLYVDNKLEDIHSGRIIGGNNIYIGTGEIDRPTRLNFQGIIDDIRVYNRALSEAEIQQLYQHNVPPEKATLISPSGEITEDNPTYTWNAVANSTWYYLWVSDSTGNKIKKWYTDDDANCGGGTGQCSVTNTTELEDGSCKWWIQTWNDYGYGPWSDAMPFTVDTGTGE